MIDLAYIDRVYLFHGVTDFRKGISGLYVSIKDFHLIIYNESSYN